MAQECVVSHNKLKTVTNHPLLTPQVVGNKIYFIMLNLLMTGITTVKNKLTES